MRKTTTLTVALLLMLPLAGCIENMRDLKDRLGSEPVEPASTDTKTDDVDPVLNDTTNVTAPPPKPPVARITVFAEGGALIYRASFIAENQTEPIVIESGGNLSLVAADSEAVEPGTELSTFEWTVDGEKMEGRKVTAAILEPGLHMIGLKVTDSKGTSDEQMIHLGIPPKPFDEATEIQGGALAGFDGTPTAQSADHPLTVLAEKDGKTLKAQKLVAYLDMPLTADLKLIVTDPSGTAVESDSGTYGALELALGSDETVTIENPAAGDWTITVSTYGGATDAYTVDVTVTYVEVVEGLGDGHAHAH